MVTNTPILAIKYKQFDSEDEKSLMKQYLKTIEDQAPPMSMNYDMFKMSYNIIMSIIASMLLGISLFMIVIVIFVIRGTIRNVINQQYKSIGVKKVLGFTNTQIRNSFLFSYGIMGAISSLMGTSVGIPIRNNIYAGIGYDMQVGLSAGMDRFMILTVVIVVGLIGLFTVLATKETQKIKPVQALKYGMPEEKFSPNQFHIRNNNRVPLSVLMATKQMLMNKKKSMTIVLTMGILVYVALLINSMGNTLATSEHFAKYLVGTTIGDYSVANHSKQSIGSMIQHIQQLDGVTNVLYVDTHINEGTVGLDGDKITIGGQVFYGNTPESFLVLTVGRKPQNNQEIVITNKLAEQSGKSVGDYMTIDTTKYLISGNMNSVILNQLCYIKLENTIPENISQENGYYWVYTDQKNVIIEKIQTQLAAQVPVGMIVSKYDSNITTILSTLEQFPAMVFTVLIVFAVVAGVVIINWTLMDISSMKRFFGILKATGFGNKHIIQMLIIKSMLLTFTGALIGFIVSVWTMNGVMLGIFKLSPFNTIQLPVLFDLKGSLLLMALFLTIAFVATLLPSRKISTISPKQLIAQ